jgi:hypothetical protein
MLQWFVYENWTARRNSGHVHVGECNHCNHGNGKRRVVQRGRCGVWIGPFSTRAYAEAYLKRRGLHGGSNCSCMNLKP